MACTPRGITTAKHTRRWAAPPPQHAVPLVYVIRAVQVMFHHNCVVRRQHMDGASTGPSYDQRLAHDIIGGWADRAASDPSICAEREMLQPFVQRVIREMDGHFGRVLSLRTSERFKSTVEIPDRPFVKH